MDKVRISMVCLHSVFGDVEVNLKNHEAFVIKASEAGSDFVCFPELSLTGYAMPDSASNTISLDSEAVRHLVRLSGEYRICILFGIAEEGGYITQVVAECGRVVGVYRKTHLGEREAAAMVPGDILPVFRTAKAVIAVQTCWESHFPEITMTYALKGADIVFMPHASGLSPERRKGSWNKVVPARAYDNTVFCATCNQVGDNGFGTVFGGGLTIAGPRGNIIAEDYSGEGMLTADLDGPSLDVIRSPGYESMRDLYFLDKRRPGIYFR